MNKNIEQWGRVLLPGLVLLVLLAGCSTTAPTSQIAQEPALPPTATPDPLYTLHCIRQSGNTDLCYVSEVLAADAERLEKVIRNFCLSKDTLVCAIHVWKEEASVAQTIPLGDADAASRIASFSNVGYGGAECYKTYSNGEVLSSSSGCQP